MQKATEDLTTGSVFQKLMMFTLPFIGSNLIQTLYTMVDLFVVGQFATTDDVAAVSIGGTIVSTFWFVIFGLGVGATVIVGKQFGAGDKESLGKTSATAFTLFGIVGIILTVVVCLVARPMLGWINTPDTAMPAAVSYVTICAFGYLFQAEYNAMSGILRGVGDSTTPLIFVTISSVLNIILDVVFVYGFSMGAAGAAIATTFAQGVCMVYGMIHLHRRNFPFDFKPTSYRFHGNYVHQLIDVGMPVAIQEVLVMASFIVIEGIVNQYGVEATAAAGILDKVFLFATISTNSFYSSVSAMVAQNIGAGDLNRCKSCLKYGLIGSELFAIAFFLVAAAAPAAIVGLFTKDAAVIAQGVNYYVGYKFEYLFCALAFTVNGFINGTGHTKLTLIGNVVSTYVIRIPLFLYISSVMGGGLYELGWALPLASVVQGIIGFSFYFSGRWKKELTQRN